MIIIRILISTIAHDEKIESLPIVVGNINKMICNTNHDVNYIIVASDKETIKFCIENDIKFQSILFDEECFENNIRTIKELYGGYDEFYLYRCLHARKMCFEIAKRDLYDYILFVDADILMEPESLNMLLKENKKDISGWFFFKKVAQTSAGMEIPDKDSDIYPVTFTGGGCRLIHKDIFLNMKYEFKSMSSDDMEIGRETQRLGYSIWIHPAIYCEHLGNEYTDEARDFKERFS